MNGASPSPGPDACSSPCSPGSTAEQLNRDCFCVAVDQRALHAELEASLAAHGMPLAMAESHPHLFSSLPIYVSERHIATTARVAAAIEEAVASPAYRSAVLAWAPEIAGFDPGSPGGLLGLDFHLGPDGPRLIEINTNPGGVLLNAVLGRAQRVCMPEFTAAPSDAHLVEDKVLEAMLAEWRLQRGTAPLDFIAIVDELPEQQYLYPEFLMFRELLRRHGLRSEICAPQDLQFLGDRLCLGDAPVDYVYNRLTDFALREPAHAVLRQAYLAGAIVLSPHPRAHALYADKRNLCLLGDRPFLEASGISATSVELLAAAVPPTHRVSSDNREWMWEARRDFFFKPAAGFGSKASYRGDKLTRRVWDEIARGTYVAQEVVPPSQRHVATGSAPLKVDIRCYAYCGEVFLFAARMYQGQTTNFRTVGGGFAPVMTSRAAASDTTERSARLDTMAR